MKKLSALFLMLATASAMATDVYVQPHVRTDGTFVQGHYRTAPDRNIQNNYSTQGNINPYTGQEGTVDPYKQPSYQQPQPIYQQPAYKPFNPPEPSRQSSYCNPAYPATCIK